MKKILKYFILAFGIILTLFGTTACKNKNTAPLQGEKGDKGDKGDKGNDGVSIIKVEKTNSDGLVDTYTISFSDDTKSTFNVTNGDDGHTPTISIGANGNWFIDNVDTEKQSKGDKGADGVSIVKVEKTNSDDLVDTYTIYYSNGESTTFTITNGMKGDDGDDGKSAYELYCIENPSYQGTLEEWLEEFYKKDDTDYSQYQNFIFNEVIYNGELGYSASYYGKDRNIVFPETYKMKPIFIANINPVYESSFLKIGYSKAEIDSIYYSSNIKVVCFNEYYNFKFRESDDFKLIFSGSIDEFNGYPKELEKVYYDGNYDSFKTTNLSTQFADAELYAKDENGEFINFELLDGLKSAKISNTDSILFIKLDETTGHHILYANEVNFFGGIHSIDVTYEGALSNIKNTKLKLKNAISTLNVDIMNKEIKVVDGSYDVAIDIEDKSLSIEPSKTNYKTQIHNNELKFFYDETEAKNFGDKWYVYPSDKKYNIFKRSYIDELNCTIQVTFEPISSTVKSSMFYQDPMIDIPVQLLEIDKDVLCEIFNEDVNAYYGYEDASLGISSNNYYYIPFTASLEMLYIEFFDRAFVFDTETELYVIKTLDIFGTFTDEQLRFAYDGKDGEILYKEIVVSSFNDDSMMFEYSKDTNSYSYESSYRELYTVSFDPKTYAFNIVCISESLVNSYLNDALDLAFDGQQKHGSRLYLCEKGVTITLPTTLEIISYDGVMLDALQLSYSVSHVCPNITLVGNQITISEEAVMNDQLTIHLELNGTLKGNHVGYDITVICQ